jgi:hypothetical protein
LSIGGVVDPLSDFGIADVSGVAGALLLGGGVIGVVEGAGEVIVGGVVGGSAGVGDLLHATSVAQAATSNACETFMRNLIYHGSALLPKHKVYGDAEQFRIGRVRNTL